METDINGFIKRMLRLLPYWHYKVDKPFKLFLRDKMSLETFYCLQMLNERGPMTMSGICHILNISKQQATSMIERLHEHQFVERMAGDTDRRFITIRVSERAVQYIEENIYSGSQFSEHLLGKLTEEEAARMELAVDTLLELLPKLD